MKKKDSLAIHKFYRKRRLIVFGVLIVTILSLTVAYSANLSSVLEMLGYVNIEAEEGKLEITSITSKSMTNATDKGTSFSIETGSSDEEHVLVANFNINYYRSWGSSTMSATYSVVIENNSFHTQTLLDMNNESTFTSGSSTISYSVSGANTGTTVLKPGESVTVNITFTLGSNSRNTNYTVSDVFKFTFSENTTDNLAFSATLETTDVTFNSNSDLKQIKIQVKNDSASEVSYNVSSKNSNFELVTATGSALSSFTIGSKEQKEIEAYLKITDDHIFAGSTETIGIEIETTSPVILTYDLGDVKASVPVSGMQKIIGNQTINDDSTIDFTKSPTTSGIFKNTVSGETTYFYRGNVTNNYVSFAGYTWRIIRIDKYGTRIILDSSIGTSKWASSNTASDLSAAMSALSYTNSTVKSTVDSWYSSNLSSYSDIIKTSLFCEDFSYQTMQSSGSYYTTYYFGSYIRNGPDSSGYTPEFVCDSKYTKSYNIGLISGDELSFAGAVFGTNNTSYYLYNSSISSYWWTLSPSYYDTTLTTVGLLVVNGSTGKMHDWENGSTIANSDAIRPVITLDTDRLSGGSGTSSDPYTFS